MKNFFKTFGIIAIIAIIGFTMTACPEDGGNGGNGGNGSGGKTSFGDKLELSGQVYTMDWDNGIPVFTKFEDDLALKSDTTMGAYGEIKGGKLTYTVGVPSAASLLAFTQFKSRFGDNFINWTISDESVKFAFIQFIEVTGSDSYRNIVKNDYSKNASGSTIEQVMFMMFMYVDNPVTITAKGSTKTENGSTTTINDLNLSLEEGWNAVYSSQLISGNFEESTMTYSISVGNPDLKWVLDFSYPAGE